MPAFPFGRVAPPAPHEACMPEGRATARQIHQLMARGTRAVHHARCYGRMRRMGMQKAHHGVEGTRTQLGVTVEQQEIGATCMASRAQDRTRPALIRGVHQQPHLRKAVANGQVGAICACIIDHDDLVVRPQLACHGFQTTQGSFPRAPSRHKDRDTLHGKALMCCTKRCMSAPTSCSRSTIARNSWPIAA